MVSGVWVCCGLGFEVLGTFWGERYIGLSSEALRFMQLLRSSRSIVCLQLACHMSRSSWKNFLNLKYRQGALQGDESHLDNLH